jgi:hypothetical protein
MGVLSSLFGSQPAQPVVGAQPLSVTEIPEQLKPYYTDILSKAQALYNKRTDEGYTPYEGPTIAPYSPEQEQAFTGIAGLQGGTAPKYAEAEQLTRDAASGITGAQIQEAMSPYQQAVTDIEKRESQKAFEQNVLPKIRAAQVAQGSFGGTRGTLLEAQSLGEQQKLLSDIQTKGSQAAFADARAALDAERMRQGQASTNLANIAGAGFKTGLAELGAQQGVGEAKQQQTQAALDEAYRQFLQEKDEPYAAMQKYQQVVSGAPISTTTYAPPPPPQPSLGQQLIGGLAGVGSLYGTFTGKPVFGEGKTGGGIAGLVKRATPGQVGNMSAYDSFMEKRKPTTFPDVTSTKGGFDTLKGSIGSLIETLKRQGVSNTQIGNLLNEEIKKDKAALINPQVAKEQAAFKAIQDTIYSPEITEAGSTGRMALAALGKTGVEVGEQVKKAKEKTRADERAIAEKEAALVKGMAADDVSAAGTAVAASEKLATIEATIAKNAATLNKMGLTQVAKTEDAIDAINSNLNANQQKQLKAGAKVTTTLGDLSVGQIYLKAADQALAEIKVAFEAGTTDKNDINQLYVIKFNQIIADIMGNNSKTQIKQGGSIASTSNTSNLGNNSRQSTATVLKNLKNP